MDEVDDIINQSLITIKLSLMPKYLTVEVPTEEFDNIITGVTHYIIVQPGSEVKLDSVLELKEKVARKPRRLNVKVTHLRQITLMKTIVSFYF
jgi:hypothetical protein